MGDLKKGDIALYEAKADPEYRYSFFIRPALPLIKKQVPHISRTELLKKLSVIDKLTK